MAVIIAPHPTTTCLCDVSAKAAAAMRRSRSRGWRGGRRVQRHAGDALAPRRPGGLLAAAIAMSISTATAVGRRVDRQPVDGRHGSERRQSKPAAAAVCVITRSAAVMVRRRAVRRRVAVVTVRGRGRGKHARRGQHGRRRFGTAGRCTRCTCSGSGHTARGRNGGGGGATHERGFGRRRHHQLRRVRQHGFRRFLIVLAQRRAAVPTAADGDNNWRNENRAWRRYV